MASMSILATARSLGDLCLDRVSKRSQRVNISDEQVQRPDLTRDHLVFVLVSSNFILHVASNPDQVARHHLYSTGPADHNIANFIVVDDLLDQVHGDVLPRRQACPDDQGNRNRRYAGKCYSCNHETSEARFSRIRVSLEGIDVAIIFPLDRCGDRRISHLCAAQLVGRFPHDRAAPATFCRRHLTISGISRSEVRESGRMSPHQTGGRVSARPPFSSDFDAALARDHAHGRSPSP